MAGAPRKFLIVDDHPGFRETIRAFLPAGLVVECGDGNEALACYAAHQPDWVLMDIEMRGLDGLAATRRLKARYPHARIIIISNHADDSFAWLAHEAGAEAFISKADLKELTTFLATH